MNSNVASGHTFSQVPEAEIQRSSLDRSHTLKTTFDSGYLVPVFVDEALPGDTFNLNLTAFCRLATPLKPIMDNMFLDVHFFAVPMRLLWSHWEEFNGANKTAAGIQSTVYTCPQMTGPSGNGILSGSLSDYLGLPVGKASVVFNSFWHRAYNLIYNSWYLDQNLQTPVTVDVDDGPDTYTDYVLLRRGKRHDYFTSCLPWTQKGTAVSLSLGGTLPVLGIGTQVDHLDSTSVSGVRDSSQNTRTYANAAVWTAFGDTTAYVEGTVKDGGGHNWPNIRVDLSSATAVTINSLRQAFQLQKLYERDARGGTRYTEILRAHFGVISPDARLQRPEYLGGGSTPINVNPVAQTTPTPASGTTTPQGNLAAFGTATARGIGFSKSFVEHCVLLGIASVRADLTYQQGLDRMFSRRTRFDFYWPALAHIGEQAVLNQEIYCNMDSNDPLVFGYQERYAEYRYKPSKITGLFRSNVSSGSTSIDYWHLSQNFGSLPTLGDTFIKETPPISRVVAVSSEPQFLFDSFFNLKCARPMPVYGVPGLVDHF